jgi:hypothetical protein
MTILVISMLLAGSGHGVFALLGLFSAPISLLGTKGAWLACIPVGAALGLLAPRREFPVVVMIHYISGIAVTTLTEFADWQRLAILPSEYAVAFVVGIVVYVVGQALLWRVWGAAGRKKRVAVGTPVAQRPPHRSVRER